MTRVPTGREPPRIESGARAAPPASAPGLPRVAARFPLCKRWASVRHTLSTSVGARVPSRARRWRSVGQTGWATAAALPPALRSSSRLRFLPSPTFPPPSRPRSPLASRAASFPSLPQASNFLLPQAALPDLVLGICGRVGDARGQHASGACPQRPSRGVPSPPRRGRTCRPPSPPAARPVACATALHRAAPHSPSCRGCRRQPGPRKADQRAAARRCERHLSNGGRGSGRRRRRRRPRRRGWRRRSPPPPLPGETAGSTAPLTAAGA